MALPPARTEISDTYPNPSNAIARVGFGRLWDYVVGLLGSTGNAAEARNALGIGSAISFRNLLINANGAINQRGYVSGTAVGSASTYTLDRWRVVTSGQNLAFGAATPDRMMTAPAGGVEQVVEGAMVAGGVHTLRWTGTASATVNGVAVANGANTPSLPANENVTVRFMGGTFSQPQLEAGIVATPYERRPIGLELTLCQRYFWAITGSGVMGVGQATGTNTCAIFIQFPTQMRAPPSFGANALAVINSVGSNVNGSAAAIGAAGFTAVTINVTTGTAGLVSGNATILVGTSPASVINFSAEL